MPRGVQVQVLSSASRTPIPLLTGGWSFFRIRIYLRNNDEHIDLTSTLTSTGMKGGRQEQKIYDIMFLNVECAANIVK